MSGHPRAVAPFVFLLVGWPQVYTTGLCGTMLNVFTLVVFLDLGCGPRCCNVVLNYVDCLLSKPRACATCGFCCVGHEGKWGLLCGRGSLSCCVFLNVCGATSLNRGCYAAVWPRVEFTVLVACPTGLKVHSSMLLACRMLDRPRG